MVSQLTYHLLVLLIILSLAGQVSGKRAYDFVVIGAGTAGCLVASKLSKQGTVLLIEQGPSFNDDQRAEKSSFRNAFETWDDPVYTKKLYNTEADGSVISGGKELLFGLGVGGTSNINAGNFDLPNVESLEDWLHTPEALSATFEKLRASLSLEYLRNQTLAPAFLRSVRSAGYDDSLIHQPLSVAKSGMRQDSYTSFLYGTTSRNLTLFANTVATRILYQKDKDGEYKATGVEVMQFPSTIVPSRRTNADGSMLQVFARREVVLSAGYVGSPKLLLLSGIGPSSSSPQVVVENVGKNLVARPLSLVMNLMPVVVDEMDVTKYKSQTEKTKFEANDKESLLRITITGALGFLRSSPNLAQPDLFLEFTDVLPLDSLTPPNLNLGVCLLLKTRSRGSVTLNSTDPLAEAVISTKALSQPQDIQDFINCLRAFQKIFSQTEFQFAGGRLFELFPGLLFDQQLDAYVKLFLRFTHHHHGTCRMKTKSQPNNYVVDETFRVQKFKNLRVIDASIIPDSPSSGLMALVYAIAELGADIILNDS